MDGQGHRLEAGQGVITCSRVECTFTEGLLHTRILWSVPRKQGLGGETLGSKGFAYRGVSLKTWLPHVADQASTL